MGLKKDALQDDAKAKIKAIIEEVRKEKEMQVDENTGEEKEVTVDNTPTATEKIKAVKDFFNAPKNKGIEAKLSLIHAAAFNPTEKDADKIKKLSALLATVEVQKDEETED